MKPIAILLLLMTFACQSTPQAKDQPPAKSEVTDYYHGTLVRDPYRWLENSASDRVESWSRKQTKTARSVLSKLPQRPQFKKRLEELLKSKEVSYWAVTIIAGKTFAFKNQPPNKQPIIVQLKSEATLAGERVILDPNTLDPSGSTSIDWFAPSPNAEIIAVSISKNGSEQGDVHFYKTASGEKLEDVIERVEGPTAGGDLIWLNNRKLLHTSYPSLKERPKKDALFYQRILSYEIGSQKRQYEYGNGYSKITAFKLLKAPDSEHVIAVSQDGDSGRFGYSVRYPNGHWSKILNETDQIAQATWGYRGKIFLISQKNAPRGKLQILDIKRPKVKFAKTIVPQAKDTLSFSFYSKRFITASKSAIATVYQLGGPSEVRIFSYSGKPLNSPAVGNVTSIGRVKAMENGDILLSKSSYTSPSFYYRYNIRNAKISKTALGAYSKVDLSAYRVIRKFAKSKDGTEIPVNILVPPSYVEGQIAPMILTGYGGFGVSSSPRFSTSRVAWLEAGGLFAQANIRGGGEYGKTWHDQGRLLNKQNVFDDFFAAAKLLVDQKFTTSKQLGIVGGSNGGLLMGAMLTQHPEFFKAVASYVGIYDSLRCELSPNGSFNIPEYGSVKNESQFKVLLSYSPYHNVKPNTKFPATLFVTGANDGRVDPMHSRKMAARMQDSQAGKAPVLLHIDWETGHGSGTPLNKRIEQLADQFAFFHKNLLLER